MSFALRLTILAIVTKETTIVAIVNILILNIVLFRFENKDVIAIVLKTIFNNAIRSSYFIFIFELRSI